MYIRILLLRKRYICIEISVFLTGKLIIKPSSWLKDQLT